MLEERCKVDAALHAELLQDLRDARRYRPIRETEGVADLSVRRAEREVLQHGGLAGREGTRVANIRSVLVGGHVAPASALPVVDERPLASDEPTPERERALRRRTPLGRTSNVPCAL